MVQIFRFLVYDSSTVVVEEDFISTYIVAEIYKLILSILVILNFLKFLEFINTFISNQNFTNLN